MENIKNNESKKVTAQEFAEKYQKLCDELGYRIVVSPSWVGTNHGSFEMVLQYTVGALPSKVDNA